MTASKKPTKPGPEAERVNIIGDWQMAVGKALKAKKPDEAPKEVQKPARK